MTVASHAHAIESRHTLKELLRDVGPVRVLSREEEEALGSVIRSPGLPAELREAAIQALMRHNLRLLIRRARKHRLPGEDLGEVVSNGAIGLRRAAEQFDPSRGCKFSTFACPWIRESIGRQRMKEANGRPWRVPVHVHGHRQRCQALCRKLASAGEEITIEEAARRLGVERYLPLFWTLDAVAYQECPDRLLENDDGNTKDLRIDNLPDNHAPEADERRELLATIRRFLPRLPARERLVIRLYYGFDAVPGIRRATGRVASEPGGLIARHLGISRERVRQIRQSALTKLRRMAEEAGCL